MIILFDEHLFKMFHRNTIGCNDRAASPDPIADSVITQPTLVRTVYGPSPWLLISFQGSITFGASVQSKSTSASRTILQHPVAVEQHDAVQP